MIQIVEEAIQPETIVNAVRSGEAGAIVTFDGTVRSHARGRLVTHLYYESYDEMACREMASIRDRALTRWSLRGLAIVHRVGRLEIGESSVFIAVSSDHRAEAFEACRYVIDSLKTTVPIWKKEYYADGEVWVEDYSGRTE